MTTRRLLGMLTPSSNTVLEPVTAALLAAVAEASAHFSRFRVTEIGLSNSALAQFDDAEILRAAELLSHARVDVIGWNGTSAGWLGFDADERLCRRITESTGIPACTSVLALNEILRRMRARRIAFVTPYVGDVQRKIIANYAAAGFDTVAERHLGWSDNWSFSTATADQLRRMIVEVSAARPEAIVVLCTGLRAAPLVEELEREIGIPILDSIATVVWQSLQLAGVDTRRVTGWGRLFRDLV
jgi:maleate isomerase